MTSILTTKEVGCLREGCPCSPSLVRVIPFSASSFIAFAFLDRCVSPMSAQHVWRFGELDAVVTNDLNSIAPKVTEVEERARQRFNACLGHRTADGVLVVDYKAKVAPTV